MWDEGEERSMGSKVRRVCFFRRAFRSRFDGMFKLWKEQGVRKIALREVERSASL